MYRSDNSIKNYFYSKFRKFLRRMVKLINKENIKMHNNKYIEDHNNLKNDIMIKLF